MPDRENQLLSTLVLVSHSVYELAELSAGLGFEVSTDPYVVMVTAEKSIKIDDIRALQQRLATRHGAPQPLRVLIFPAERITLPAQQALLKLLEEPPVNVQIFLIARSRSNLLPTILSRCVEKTIQLDREGETPVLTLWEQWCECESWQEKVELTQSLPTDREELKGLLQAELCQTPGESREQVQFMGRVLEAYEGLVSNVSPALCVEHLLLQV